MKSFPSLYLKQVLLPFVVTGTIEIDGYDIRNIQLDSLRRHVGLVSQDIVSDMISLLE